MNDTPEMDAALEQRLRSYFAARYGEPSATTALWTEIQSRLDGEPTETSNEDAPSGHEPRQTRALPSQHTTRRRTRRWLVALGPLAAVLAVIIVAAYLFANRPHAGRPPTVSNTPTKSGIWNDITLPRQVVAGGGVNTFAVAPSNGSIAYLCDTASGSARVWKTADAGRTWSLLPATLAATPKDRCYLNVDQSNPNTIELAFVPPAISTGSGSGSQPRIVVSFDGVHWQAMTGEVPDGAEHISTASDHFTLESDLVTHGDTSYGIDGAFHLVRSQDHMQTWTRIDAPMFSEAVVAIYHVWVQPVSGRILVEAMAGDTPELWTSVDQGQTWTRLWRATAPNDNNSGFSTLFADGFAAIPQGNDTFVVCALRVTSFSPFHVTLECSKNGGRTWSQRPVPAAYPYADPRQFVLTMVGVDQRGSVLLAGAPSVSASSTGEIGDGPIGVTMQLLLLPADATQASGWQDLGQTQDVSPTFLFGSTSSGTVVWELPYTASNTVYTTAVP